MDRKVCLLIDDDHEDREVFSEAMSKIPSVTLFTIADGREAIQKIRGREIQPDIIFLDLNMPGFNGYEFLVYLKGQMRCAKIPVIVYSTSDDAGEVLRTKKLGAHGFFRKPDCSSELSVKLCQLLMDIGICKETSVP
jgi:CheY-like chemotaxis protein